MRSEERGRIIVGDARTELAKLPAESVDCCVTSPPYWGLRDYGVDGQLGLERTPGEYVAKLVGVFGEVRRVLKKTGTLWLVIGDSYIGGFPRGDKFVGAAVHTQSAQATRAMSKTSWRRDRAPREDDPHKRAPGLKPKDLVGIPWRVALALQADGWYLRSDIIWHKPNAMFESCLDRPTRAHEYVFLLAKGRHYDYDRSQAMEPVAEYERRRREREHVKGLKTRYALKADRPHGQHAPGQTSAKRTAEMRQELAARGTRNRRDVWTIAVQPSKIGHHAMFPEKLAELCVAIGCPPGGTVLDPFFGAGTTGLAAQALGRRYLGIELNPKYAEMAAERLKREGEKSQGEMTK